MMYVYISLYLSIDSGLHLVGIYTFGSISIYVDLFGYVNNDLENHVLIHLLNGFGYIKTIWSIPFTIRYSSGFSGAWVIPDIIYIFHTATIVIYNNIQWHSQKVRIKTCSHLFSTVPQTLCLHNPYVCKAVSYRLIFVFVCLLRFWLSGFLICFIWFTSSIAFLNSWCNPAVSCPMEHVWKMFFLGHLNIWFQIFPEALEALELQQTQLGSWVTKTRVKWIGFPLAPPAAIWLFPPAWPASGQITGGSSENSQGMSFGKCNQRWYI